MRGRAVASLAALGAAILASCGGSQPEGTRHDIGTQAARQAGSGAKTTRGPALKRARCPADAANCRSAEGRIVYVEAVDPDGDGDAHFVLASAEGVTAPGISVIDVERELRPHPLPGVGDRVSAAGPVYTGSYGQRQIQATELHTAEG